MIFTQNLGYQELKNIRKNIIMKEILDCYSFPFLLGKFRIESLNNLDIIHVLITHLNSNAFQTLQICFPEKYPNQSIKIYVLQFDQDPQQIQKNIYHLANQNIKLKYVLVEIYKKLENLNKNFYKKKNTSNSKANIEISQNQQHIEDKNSFQQENLRKESRKNSAMTGCADKELTQTKNLNRHFRSKLREVHRDLTKDSHPPEDSKFIEQIFNPNRVGFDDIRRSLKNEWFKEGVRKQMCSGKFLHKILRGMMGIKSKKLMIKYYHVMVSAVQDPDTFIRWKYDE